MMKTRYIILLFIATAFCSCSEKIDDESSKPAPTVVFSFSTGDGYAPDTIQFTNQSANADSYQWEFGDDSSSTQINPSHIFQLPGTYSVKLTAVNTGGSAFKIKQLTIEPDTELTSAKNYVLAESIFTNVFVIVEKALTACSGGILNSCCVITNDTLSSPKTLTIDFGSTNCAGTDTKPRRGKISVSYNGQYDDAGAVHQIIFTDYYENNHLLTGNIQLTNNGLNGANNSTYSLALDTKISLASSPDSIIWNAQKNIEWTQGESTPFDCTDDIYQISGTADGIISNGKNFSSSITAAVQRQLVCVPIVIGKIDLTPNGKAIRTIDFGNGACDNVITVTLNDNDFFISAY